MATNLDLSSDAILAADRDLPLVDTLRAVAESISEARERKSFFLFAVHCLIHTLTVIYAFL